MMGDVRAQPADLAHVQSPRGEASRIVAATLVLSVTPAAVTMQPGMVQGMVDFLGFSQAQAGFVASAEVFGMLAGTIVVALVGGRMSWAALLLTGLVAACVFGAASVGRRGYEEVLILRSLAGLGAGVATAIGWSMLGATRDPSRSFGWGVAGIILFAALGFAVLPKIFAFGGYDALLAALALCSALCLPAALFARRSARGVETLAEHGRWSFVGGLALISFLALSTAYPMAWTYMSLAGRDAGVSGEVVAQVFSATQFFGVAGALLIAAIGASRGFVTPATVVLGGGAIATASLVVLQGAPAFFAANAVFQFAWNAGIPIVLGVIADSQVGRTLFRYAVPLQFVGMAAAPGAAAALIRGEDFSRVVWVATALCVLSLLALFPLVLARRR